MHILSNENRICRDNEIARDFDRHYVKQRWQSRTERMLRGGRSTTYSILINKLAEDSLYINVNHPISWFMRVHTPTRILSICQWQIVAGASSQMVNLGHQIHALPSNTRCTSHVFLPDVLKWLEWLRLSRED